jgi:flagellar hook-length control protein FliK
MRAGLGRTLVDAVTGLIDAGRTHATLPATLRVAGLTYAGLGGIAAVSLVLLVAVAPVPSGIQQATEPARQVVSSLVQPAGDAMSVWLGGATVRTELPAVAPTVTILQPAPLAEQPLDVPIDVEEPTAEPEPEHEPESVVVVVPTWTPVAAVVEPEDVIAEEVEEEASEPEITAEPVVVPAEPALVIASEPPKVLSTVPPPTPAAVPTEMPVEPKARKVAEEQVAIDKIKAEQAQDRLDAEQAAADARHAAEAEALAARSRVDGNEAAIAASRTHSAVPTPVIETPATPTTATGSLSATQRKAEADAANQAAIDRAKAEKAQAKLAADAANEAAIAAAKGIKLPTATPPAVPPTPTPVPATATPVPAPTEAPAAEARAEDEVVSDGDDGMAGVVDDSQGMQEVQEAPAVHEAQTPLEVQEVREVESVQVVDEPPAVDEPTAAETQKADVSR